MTRRPWWFWALASLIGLAVLIGIIVVVLWLPSTLYRYVDEPKDRAAAEASTRTGMIAGLAGLAALGSLAITARTYRLTEQGPGGDPIHPAIEPERQ